MPTSISPTGSARSPRRSSRPSSPRRSTPSSQKRYRLPRCVTASRTPASSPRRPPRRQSSRGRSGRTTSATPASSRLSTSNSRDAMPLHPLPTPPGGADDYLIGRRAAWFAFVMTFALMLVDYIDRQVIVSLFPHIKTEWGLSDKQLGGLVSVVSVTVAIGALPLPLPPHPP